MNRPLRFPSAGRPASPGLLRIAIQLVVLCGLATPSFAEEPTPVGDTPAPTQPTPAPTGPPAATPAPSPAAKGTPHIAEVTVKRGDGGLTLQVDGQDFMVFGMNWGYTPVGENYRYDLWGKSDDFIREVLEREMTMLKGMGVNAIRLFSDIPPKWVTYIYERWGIYTAVNHLMGRYGFAVDGVYIGQVDYGDPRMRKAILDDLERTVTRYRDTPGVLMYLLGNENNYGLVWTSAEIEALPTEEKEHARAEQLYTLLGEGVATVKRIDKRRPVSLTNGDLGYIDLIAKHVVPRGLDIMGSNVYRGASSRDLFERVMKELGLPFVYTEFGADAFDAKRHREDDVAQARYLRDQWQEIYAQSAGKGGVGNAIGGFIFQWADGWWKYRQETNLDVQDDNASWPNKGYPDDYVEGRNNMNEEWFGIAALGPRDAAGFSEITPRTAYYLLKAGFALPPYAPTTTREVSDRHWESLAPIDFASRYQAAKAAAEVKSLGRFRVRDLRLDLSTYVTGGSRLDDAARDIDGRFDHEQSVTLEIEARPADQVKVGVGVNILGHVAQNPIDEIRYERRGRPRTFEDADGARVEMRDLERVKLYSADVHWEEDLFLLEAFYRTGHGHWGYEGDAFGLYPEAYYGSAVDVYDADAPIGLAFTGKGDLDGVKLAFGPQLWWGANPALVASWRRVFGPLTLTVVHHEDISRQTAVATSSAVPERVNRRSSLTLEGKLGKLNVQLAGLVSGTNRVGEVFYDAHPTADGDPSYAESGWLVTRDQIEAADTLGGRLHLSADLGGVLTVLQGGVRGLVADGGADHRITWTGWSLGQPARGNHWAVSGGAAFQVGYLQIAPYALYQKPFVGPLPNTTERYDVATNTYYPALGPRNILSDAFAVLDNRETLGLELLFAYDPTPGTWMWAWDNDLVEDAAFAWSLDLVYRHYPTSRDALLGFTADGAVFAFPAAPPATDLFEATARFVSSPGDGVRLVGRLWAGEGQARGNDPRKILRWGTDLRVTWERLAVSATALFDDWGPYDYHRDFNYTFPVQLKADLSYGARSPEWLGRLYSRIGVKAQVRTLDQYSNRYRADESGNMSLGTEWEIMTYLQLMLGGVR